MIKLLALVNGGWVDILPNSNNLTWSSDTDNLAVQLNFDSIYELEVGTIVSLMKNEKEIFRTVVITITEKRNTYTYNCYDYMWYFNKSKLIMQFNGASASDAITQLCNKEGIKCDIAPMNTKITKIYKQEISSIISDILRQVEDETGDEYIKFMNVNVFTICKLTDLYIYPRILIGSELSLEYSMEEMKNSIVVTCDQKNVSAKASATNKKGSSGAKRHVGRPRKDESQGATELDWRMFNSDGSVNTSLVADAPTPAEKPKGSKGGGGSKATSKGTGGAKGKPNNKKNTLTSETADGDNIAKYGLLQEIIEVDEKNYSQAVNMAEKKLEKLNRIQTTASVNILALEDGEDIVANRFIYLQVPSKGLDGWYKIKNASHNLNNEKHIINLTVEVV